MLQVLPGLPDEPVEILLQTRKLSDMPKCVAMSYQWGDSSELDVVYCQGGKLHVTTNLWHLLKQLRQSGKTTPKDLFWIDALCINQTDLNEKAQQVPLMGSIYENASFVWVWLGEGDERTVEALSIMSSFAKEQKILQKEIGKGKRPPWEIDDPTEFVHSEAVQKLAQGPSWLAVRDLYDSDYFSRVWPLQEMVLAPKSRLFIICGAHNISWEKFSGAAQFIKYCAFLREGRAGRSSLSAINAIRILRNNYQAYAWSINLCQLVLFTNSITMSVTYSCDRIFGILGMLNDRYSGTKSSIHVDYRAPTEKVFQNAASSIVTYDQSLDFLFVLNYRPDDRPKTAGGDKWPSWVPDFGDRMQGLEFSLREADNIAVDSDTRKSTRLGELYNTVCDTDENFSEDPHHLIDGDTLIIWGFILDVVIDVTPNFPPRTVWNESRSFTNPEWTRKDFRLLHYPYEQQSRLISGELSSFVQSLAHFNPPPADRNLKLLSPDYLKNGPHTRPRELKTGESELFGFWSGYCGLIRYWRILYAALPSTVQEVLPPPLDEPAERFYRQMNDNMALGAHSRNLFHLRDGMFGIGPAAQSESIPLEPSTAASAVEAGKPTPQSSLPAVQPGDIIVIACNYGKPLVLRRKMDPIATSESGTGKEAFQEGDKVYYTLIGNAFVGNIETYAKSQKIKKGKRDNRGGLGGLRKFNIR